MAIEKSRSPGEFVSFERAGWNANIGRYADAFGVVSRQTVPYTLDAAGVRAGMRVLDVCTGPGMMVEAAIARGAQAIGVDFSEDAVGLAKRLVPAGEFRQGNAQSLPFHDDTFDAAVCNYGVIHVPEPERALREMVRVVRPGGRVAIGVWDSTTPNNGFSLVYVAVRAHGTMDVPVPHGPDYFQFSTDEKMRAALAEVGLTKLQTRMVEQRWNVTSASQYMQAMLGGTVRAGAVLTAQTDAAKAKILGFLEQTLAGMPGPRGGFDLPLAALIGSGTKG